jgi:hypothetical protein
VPSDARYEGHGIARSDSAAAGSLDELAGVVVLAPSQNPALTPTPCPGSIPEDIEKLILRVASQERIDPTLLSVAMRHE